MSDPDYEPLHISDYWGLKKRLGHGPNASTPSRVWSFVDSRVPNREYAIKFYPKKFAEEFETESKILNRLRHPSIIKLKKVIQTDEGNRAIVMEKAHGGSLWDLLETQFVYPEDAAAKLMRTLLKFVACYSRTCSLCCHLSK